MATTRTLDPAKLRSAVDRLQRTGVPGVFAEVRDGDQIWRGASGVADVSTGRPVTPDLRHRVGSITKTFTAAAILQQVEQGRVWLDAPIGRYLPRLVPGGRGRLITVRMLLNHTSGLADYAASAFPSLKGFPSLRDISPESLDDNRFRRFEPAELIAMGLATPAAGVPGGTPGTYSNTNYLLLGQLLEKVTGSPAEEYITRNVIERAALAHTEFPNGPRIDGPHSRMYEPLYGLIDPPRDYSVYDMSWARTAADLVSTVEDLNRFFSRLFAGEIVDPSSLAQMRRTVPVIAFDGMKLDYGLGLSRFPVPGREPVWGNGGTVWGAATMCMIDPDSERQLSVALNTMRWNELDASKRPRHHPIDDALPALYQQAMC